MKKIVTTNGTTVRAYETGQSPELVAEDVQISLPEIASNTTTVSAMGDFDVPVIGQIGDMEGSVHNNGVNSDLIKLLKQKPINLDIRWAEQQFNEDGSSVIVGCKAILTVFPKVVAPAVDVEKGNVSDLEVKFGITKYQMFHDGVELWNVDRLNHKLVVGGIDYYQDIGSVL